jgi:hypothetical protein
MRHQHGLPRRILNAHLDIGKVGTAALLRKNELQVVLVAHRLDLDRVIVTNAAAGIRHLGNGRVDDPQSQQACAEKARRKTVKSLHL